MSDTIEPAKPTESAFFSDIVKTALDAAITPEKIAAAVSVHVERLVTDAVRSAFDSYSGTGKAISTVIAASVQVKDLNIPSYGSLVSEIVRRQVEARVAEVVAGKLAADLEDLLSLAPKRIKLSELVEELVGAPGSEEPLATGVTCDVNWGDGSTANWVTVKISAREVDGWRNVDVQLNIRTESGRLGKDGNDPEGTIAFGHVSGADLKKDHLFGYAPSRTVYSLGRGHSFEQRVLALYACGTVIVLDEDSVVTERDY